MLPDEGNGEESPLHPQSPYSSKVQKKGEGMRKLGFILVKLSFPIRKV